MLMKLKLKFLTRNCFNISRPLSLASSTAGLSARLSEQYLVEKSATNANIRVTLGSISSTYLREAFTLKDPKSPKRQSSDVCLFALLASRCAKAAHKTLVKLTPGVRVEHVHLVPEVAMLNGDEISATPPRWSVLAAATNLNHRIHIVKKQNFLE